MITSQFLLVANGKAVATFPTQLQAVFNAWRMGFTSYDVVPVLVADLSGGSRP